MGCGRIKLVCPTEEQNRAEENDHEPSVGKQDRRSNRETPTTDSRCMADSERAVLRGNSYAERAEALVGHCSGNSHYSCLTPDAPLIAAATGCPSPLVPALSPLSCTLRLFTSRRKAGVIYHVDSNPNSQRACQKRKDRNLTMSRPMTNRHMPLKRALQDVRYR